MVCALTFFLLLGGLLGACVAVPSTEPSLPTVPANMPVVEPSTTSVTTTVTVSWILTRTNTVLDESWAFPIREITGVNSLEEIASQDIPRLALSRAVTDVTRLLGMTTTPTVTWVFTSDEGLGGAATWRESATDPMTEFGNVTRAVEMVIASDEVITFTATTDGSESERRAHSRSR